MSIFSNSPGDAILVYVDESGDTGTIQGSSITYTLGCVMVESSNWVPALDSLKFMRRRFKNSFSIPMNAEIKSNYLIRGSGDIKNLGLAPSQRSWVFREHLRTAQQFGAFGCFAICVRKSPGMAKNQIFQIAWNTLFQRLERTSRANGNRPVILIHDDGENLAVRKMARLSRRHLTAGSLFGNSQLINPFGTLIEDPFPKISKESYFIQLADIVAYSAFRRIIPPSKKVGEIVKQNSWSELGAAVFAPVNQMKVITEKGIVEI